MTDYERLFETALVENPAELSERGGARRAAMASELIRAVRHRRRARAAVRAASLAAAAAVLLLSFWPRTPALPEPASSPTTRLPAVQIVRSDPGVLSRYVVRNRSPEVAYLDDEDLLLELERAGHRSGFLRAGGRVFLTDPLPEPSGEQGPM